MKRLTTLILMVVFFGGLIYADNDFTSHDVTMNVISVVLIDLNDTSTITLNTIAPANGGEDPTGETDNSKLLQYTSLVSAGTHRQITANWDVGDTAPAGTSLLLQATSVPAGCGTAGAQITVDDTARVIIDNIGSCATGTGANGAELTYTFSIDDVSQLVVGDSETVTITLTLTDAL
jgi:hypothetical protein